MGFRIFLNFDFVRDNSPTFGFCICILTYYAFGILDQNCNFFELKVITSTSSVTVLHDLFGPFIPLN